MISFKEDRKASWRRGSTLSLERWIGVWWKRRKKHEPILRGEGLHGIFIQILCKNAAGMELWCLEESPGAKLLMMWMILHPTVRSLISVCIPWRSSASTCFWLFFFLIKSNVDSQKSCRISAESSHVPPANLSGSILQNNLSTLSTPGHCLCCSASNK